MHVQYQFLAAMENDRLRTAPHRQGLQEARRDHAARLATEQGFGALRPSRTRRARTRLFWRWAAEAAA